MNLNNLILSGFLSRDPELRKTTTGKSVCTLGLAINSMYKGKHEVTFVDIKVWNASGEACAQYLKKGSGVSVIGSLKQDRWKDDAGNMHYKHYVLAQRVEFGSSKGKVTTADENSAAAEAAPEEAMTPPAVIPEAMMF